MTSFLDAMEKRANNTNVNNSFINNQYKEMSYSTGASQQTDQREDKIAAAKAKVL